MNRHGFIAFMLSTFFAIVISSLGKLLQIPHAVENAENFKFLVVGDWGRKGNFNQSEVAKGMAEIGDIFKIEFVISTGDNFYPSGLQGIGDSAFKKSFIDIYFERSLQKPWYIVLGNHDYMGDVLAQVNPNLRRRDNRWICHRSYIVNTEYADFFFVDTTPLVSWYFTSSEYDQRGLTPTRVAYEAKLLEDLNLALQKSKAVWKFVIGHHPIRSSGEHGDTLEVKQKLLPILLRHKADFYVNGHDHSMQHYKPDDNSEERIQFITSGGGSKAWANIRQGTPEEEMAFYHDGQGFMLGQITKTYVYIGLCDVKGKVIHRWTTRKTIQGENKK